MPLTITAFNQSVGAPSPVSGGPDRAVAAIFTADKNERETNPLTVRNCLGTGFLVNGYDIHFVTARHVVAAPLAQDEELVLAFNLDSGFLSIPVNSLSLSDSTDLAFGTLLPENDVTIPGFQIARTVPINTDCSTLEHSGTGRNVSAGGMLYNVRYRRGNIVSSGKYEYEGILSESTVFEMSYPCLWGASGSPVFNSATLELVGMMVQNVDHELAPSQLIKAVDDEGQLIEEIKYTIPQGIALSAVTINSELDVHVLH
ncbi:MAG TPA: serine protease [Candidatus Saccharimonadales bacterium]|nr:serine protease [Candidatus Saccharimonadales bacterium]